MKIYRAEKQNGLPSGYHFTLLLAVALLAALPGLTGAAQSLTTPQAGIENFGQVDDHYYRGSQPRAAQFAELKKLGVKTVIDLRKDSEDAAPEWARKEGLRYFNIPLTTKRAATEEQTAYFLTLVNDPANWPVYVHCKGGRHRTGEMTAVYRITHDGWTAEQAYREMNKYDFEDSFFYPKALRKYVFSFYERYGGDKAAGARAAGQALGPLK
jgi:tyrosine-protein phosphatase SIW14